MQRLILCLACLLTATAGAVTVDLGFHYDDLPLRNGKVYKDVALRSYNTVSGNVAVVSGRQLLSLPLGQFPDEIAARIRDCAPKLSPAEMQEEKRQAALADQAAKQRIAGAEKRGQAEAVADRNATRTQDVRRAEMADERTSAVEEEIARASAGLARHYFRYEADRYSSQGWVFDTDVILEYPEQVPGWANRWRVKGRVGVQYVTRNASGFDRKTRNFEMLVEKPEKGPPKLVDLAVK